MSIILHRISKDNKLLSMWKINILELKLKASISQQIALHFGLASISNLEHYFGNMQKLDFSCKHEK